VDLSLHNPAMTRRKHLKHSFLSGLREGRVKLLTDVRKLRETAGWFCADAIHRYLDSNLRF
jgi:hypothetical protein